MNIELNILQQTKSADKRVAMVIMDRQDYICKANTFTKMCIGLSLRIQLIILKTSLLTS